MGNPFNTFLTVIKSEWEMRRKCYRTISDNGISLLNINGQYFPFFILLLSQHYYGNRFVWNNFFIHHLYLYIKKFSLYGLTFITGVTRVTFLENGIRSSNHSTKWCSGEKFKCRNTRIDPNRNWSSNRSSFSILENISAYHCCILDIERWWTMRDSI